MKVALINPPNTFRDGDDFYVTFPLGLAYLAAYLEQHGHTVRVLDSLAGYEPPKEPNEDGLYRAGMDDSEIIAWLRSESPDLVGVTCAYTVQYPTTRSLARAIKRATDLPVVIGGAHCSAVPDEVLRDGCFDYVVIGEGEVPLISLCAHLERGASLEGVRGIAYMKDEHVVLFDKEPLAAVDAVPEPARHLFDMSHYINSDYSHNGTTLQKPYATMITSRGCPLKCSFCSVHTIWGRNNRTRNANLVVDEIEHLYNDYGIREVHFEDDMLTLDRDRLVAICDEIVRRKLDITWTTPNGVYVNTLDRRLLTAASRSGCYQFALAIESGNQDVLRRLMNKNVSLRYARDVVRMMRELGLGVYFFFIIGMPGETEADILDTIAYAKELQPDEAYFSIATPYPGTPLYELCNENGYIPRDYDYTLMRPTQPLIETEQLSRDDVRRLCDYAYAEWEAAKPASPIWKNNAYAGMERRGGVYTFGKENGAPAQAPGTTPGATTASAP